MHLLIAPRKSLKAKIGKGSKSFVVLFSFSFPFSFIILLLFLFQIFYDQESEVLLSHNCSSHVQKVEVRAAKTHPIEWNSVPLAVVCAFPYILAFSTDAIEFRYAVNGSLLQTLGMPELQLITAKVLKHTILKIKFLSKNSILTKPQQFHEFFTQNFLTIFVKSHYSKSRIFVQKLYFDIFTSFSTKFFF